MVQIYGRTLGQSRLAPGRRIRTAPGWAGRSRTRCATRSATGGCRRDPAAVVAGARGRPRIARNTVADAYGQLAAEGWLTARAGAGTWVTDRGRDRRAVPPSAAGKPGATRLRYDLRRRARPGRVPRREWLAAGAPGAGAASADHVLGYPDPRGLARLREALAGYTARARGVAADPERMVVCARLRARPGLLSPGAARPRAGAVAVESLRAARAPRCHRAGPACR